MEYRCSEHLDGGPNEEWRSMVHGPGTRVPLIGGSPSMQDLSSTIDRRSEYYRRAARTARTQSVGEEVGGMPHVSASSP